MFFLFLLDKVFLLAESPPPPSFHPRYSLSEVDVARCKLGVLVYSRCCHLLVDLRFHLFDRSWARR